jgi:hypothetical protein
MGFERPLGFVLADEGNSITNFLWRIWERAVMIDFFDKIAHRFLGAKRNPTGYDING